MGHRIFITGAAGFIGAHAALHFQGRGDEVLGFDNFNDYYDVSLKEARAQKLSNHSIPTLRGDLCDRETLKKALDDFQPTHILHLAAQAGVRYSRENPLAYVKSNLEGFVNILEEAKRLNAPLIYASSSSVYGDNEAVPFSEEHRTDDPASLYGATKKANEQMALIYHKQYGLDVTGLRFFTVYGPWGRPDMAYYLFTEAIMQGNPIKVFNRGHMMRDFTYIDDIVDGIAAAVDHCDGCHIYNLGRGEPVHLGNFIETIESALGKNAEKELLPMQPGDVVQTFADISEAQKDLGYYPKTSVKEGIEQFVAWYLDWTSLGKEANAASDDTAANPAVL